MSLTVISNQPFAVEPHTIPTMMATGEPVKFYDKDARLLPCDADPEWPEKAFNDVWVRGEMQNTSGDGLQMNDMLQRGRVLAMAEEKGLVFQRKDDGNIIFYSVMSAASPLSAVTSVDDLRALLRTTFAGWHNAYHEVFAMAKSFSYFLASKIKPEPVSWVH